MSFSFNEGLSDNQIDLKDKITREILRDYGSVCDDPRGAISKTPRHGDIEEFIDAIAELIAMDQETAEQRVMLKDQHAEGNIMEDPDDPAKELSGVVLYAMKRRAPGTMAGGNVWFNRERREVKPRIREIITNDPNNPSQAKIVYSQWFDNEVLFEIVARTNKRANELALWLEDLLERNRTFFMCRGFQRYLYNMREEDGQKQYGNDNYHVRPLCYFVRTERTNEVSEQTLNRLVITLTQQ